MAEKVVKIADFFKVKKEDTYLENHPDPVDSPGEISSAMPTITRIKNGWEFTIAIDTQKLLLALFTPLIYQVFSFIMSLIA